MKQVDDRHARCLPREHRMQLADVGIGETEIGKKDNHGLHASLSFTNSKHIKQKSRAQARLLVHARSNRHYSVVALAADFLRVADFFLGAVLAFLTFLALPSAAGAGSAAVETSRRSVNCTSAMGAESPRR